MLAIVEAHRAGLLARAHWWRNTVSGVVVGVVALPLAMAFAIASGATPQQGLHTAIIAGLIVSIFGGSRLQIAGPTGAFVAILAGVTAKYGIDGLQTATLMAGAMLVLFGFARLGGIIRFIPDPVIVGFTAGIAVIIFVGQWRYFFGLPPSAGEHFHQKLWATVQTLPAADASTTALAVVSLAVVLLVPRVPVLRRVPAPLVALVGATAFQAWLQPSGVATIGSAFGGIPSALPSLSMPDLSIARMLELLGPAFAIAMLGAIESLLSAVVADGMAGTRHDSNQELIGQGLANLFVPILGGFAATGAIARTATNVRSGATSPLSGVVHAATLLICVAALAPFARHVPLAALAAVLFVVAWNMSDAPHFAKMVRRAPRADVAILIVTFLLTVFADLVVAVNIGVILAVLQFMRRITAAVDVRQASDRELRAELADLGLARLPSDVAVYAIEGPFFFAAVEKFERAIVGTHTAPRVLILRLRWVPFIDITGLQTLEEVVGQLQRRGIDVWMCEGNERVVSKLERAGVTTLVQGRMRATLAEALGAAAKR
jgi:SulP family sulfate permease